MKGDTIPTNTRLFKAHITHTPEEILAAGGATVFGRKFGKKNENLIEASQNAPAIDPFTEEEWQQTLQQLKDSQ